MASRDENTPAEKEELPHRSLGVQRNVQRICTAPSQKGMAIDIYNHTDS
jgi:hypothetical protein